MALFDADKSLSPKDRKQSAKKADASNKKPSSKNSGKVNKGPCKKGYQWSAIVAAPEGMLMPKSFEKVYTLTDIKKRGNDSIAVVDMSAATSSKRAADTPADEQQKMNFFANMFDEKDNYTGKMVLNLTTGEIDSYQELLKAEWLAVEPSQEQKSDKGPDQLTMGFSSLFSIEKVK
jgi:hypothetical protein